MIYLLIVFFGSSCFAHRCWANPPKDMSISQNYIAEFDSLYARAKEYGNSGRNEEALPYAQHAYEVALLSADSLRIVMGGRVVSQLLLRLSRGNDAIKFALAVLPIAERNNFDGELSIVYNSLGAYYALVADYQKALMYHFKSLEIRQIAGDDGETSVSFHNLGFVYYKLQDYTLALEYFNKALSLKTLSGDDYDLPNLLVNISLCHSVLNNHDEARRTLDLSMHACQPRCTPFIRMQQRFASGMLSYRDEDIDQAELSFRRSYELAVDLKNKRFQAENLLYIARIASAQANHGKALQYLDLLENICVRENYNLLLERALGERVALYRELGRHTEAWLYQDRYMAIKDKIFNEQIANKILQIHSENAAKHRQVLKNHNLEILARQKIQNTLAVSVVVILIFLAIALYLLAKQKQRINVKLAQKVQDRARALEGNQHRLNSELSVLHTLMQKGHNGFRAELASIQGIADYLSRGTRTNDTVARGVDLLGKSISRLDFLLKTIFPANHAVGNHSVNLSEWIETLYVRFVVVKKDFQIERLIDEHFLLPENDSVLIMIERVFHWISFTNYPVRLRISNFKSGDGMFLSLVVKGIVLSSDNPIYINCLADGQMLRLSVKFQVEGSDTQLIIPVSSPVLDSESS